MTNKLYYYHHGYLVLSCILCQMSGMSLHCYMIAPSFVTSGFYKSPLLTACLAKPVSDRFFVSAAPSLWNPLPYYLKSTNSLQAFNRELNTHLNKCLSRYQLEYYVDTHALLTVQYL